MADKDKKFTEDELKEIETVQRDYIDIQNMSNNQLKKQIFNLENFLFEEINFIKKARSNSTSE